MVQHNDALYPSEAFVVCQHYSPPKSYKPTMSNPLLDLKYGELHHQQAVYDHWTRLNYWTLSEIEFVAINTCDIFVQCMRHNTWCLYSTKIT